jgi:hypothetical protein
MARGAEQRTRREPLILGDAGHVPFATGAFGLRQRIGQAKVVRPSG